MTTAQARAGGNKPPTPIDVVIIGASVAGLAAAATLRRAEVPFVVLEKEPEHLGGMVRTLSATPAHPEYAYLDTGPSYISPVQNFVLEAVLRLGLPVVETPLDPKLSWLFESSTGTILTLPGSPDTFPGGKLALVLIGTIDALTLMVRTKVTVPEEMPGAAMLDSLSIKDWLEMWFAGQPDATPLEKAHVTQAFACAVRSVFAAELEQISFLYMLWQGATAGSFSMLIAPAGGFTWRLAYGAQDLVQRLADEVGDDRIVRATEVRQLNQTADGVLVRLTHGGSYLAKYVIIATRPRAWTAHELDTPDPAVRASLARHKAFAAVVEHGRAVKAWVFYKRPFWLDQGVQATVLAARETERSGPITWTLDHTWTLKDWDPQRPLPRHRYAIACWISEKYLEDHKPLLAGSTGARKRAVIEQLKRLYGPLAESELLDPDVDGCEPYLDTDMLGATRNQLATWLGPGQLTSGTFQIGTLGTAGPVAYASSALSAEWAGTIEAELHVGVRSATLAVQHLQTSVLNQTVSDAHDWQARLRPR